MVLSYLWACMVLLALAASFFCGTQTLLAAAALEGAQKAVTVIFSMAGALCLWMGISKVMEKSGISAFLARLFRPLLGRIFPKTAGDATAMGHLCANFTANLLGLGNAATPLGIRAVLRMQELESGETASDEMCRLIVLNTASIQLIPSTVAAVRASLGAAAPFDILPAVWLSSFLSASMGLLAAKCLGGRKHRG